MRAATGVVADARAELGWRPSAVLLWWTHQTHEGVVSGNRGGIAFATDGVTEAVAWHSEDGGRATNAATRFGADVRVVFRDAGFDVEGVAAGAVHYLALGDVDARAGVLGREGADGFGFEPDVVLLLGAGAGGFAVTLGAAGAAEACVAVRSRDGAAPADVAGAQVPGRALALLGDGLSVASAASAARRHDGFTLAWDGAALSQVAYLALGGVRARIGTGTSPRAPGRRRTRVGWRPDAALLFSWGLGHRDAPRDICRLCVGAATDGASGCAGWDDRDTPGETVATHSCSSANNVLLVTDTQTGGVHAAAAFGGFGLLGFTLDWTRSDGHEREFVYVALRGRKRSASSAGS